MNDARRVLLLATIGALGLAGCTGEAVRSQFQIPATAQVAEGRILWAPTTWSGEVRVVQPLIVTRTASLTLQPGTRVYFDLPEPQDGKGREPWILIQGNLVAQGTAEQPIVFTSAALRHSELDDMIHVQDGKEVHLRHCVFERGPWALHIHNTPVEVIDSTFRDNYGGVRFQGDKVVLRGNRFTDNRIGVRGLKGSPVIEQNEFIGNLTGVFFREGVVEPVVRHNNFDNSEYNLKLGEAQIQDVDAAHNWWASSAEGRLQDRIFDGGDSQGVGFVTTEPVLAHPWGAARQQ